MAQRPTVRWNEQKQRWMAWVRFPDGSRRKVERVEKADAQRDLDELVTLRAQASAPDPARNRQATFAEVIEAWFAAGCPNVSPSRTSRHAREKSPNTIANARQLLGTSVLPKVGSLKVDRTTTQRLEELFESMVETHATSTIDRNWNYLNQALQHGVRNRTIKTNPAADVLLPAKRPSKERKSFSVDQAHALLTEAIPADPRPAMWLTGLMCGLRPGELAGLRWPYVDIDSHQPVVEVFERAHEVDDKYVGQETPKTKRSKRRLALHPLNVAALQRHREEQKLLGLYDAEGFVFCTRNGTPMSLTNMRRSFKKLCQRAGMGDAWTTYELRHSFVSLVSDQLDDLVKVADLAGHVDTRTTEGYRHAVRPSLPTPSRRGTPCSGRRRRATCSFRNEVVILHGEGCPGPTGLVEPLDHAMGTATSEASPGKASPAADERANLTGYLRVPSSRHASRGIAASHSNTRSCRGSWGPSPQPPTTSLLEWTNERFP